jgi:hypothetical protein
MIHLGNVPAGSTLYIPFTTYDANGASVTLTGLAVTDIEIYKNGSTTQRASDAGYALLDTDGIDFDGVTGLHGFSVDLNDNTDSGFFAAGSFYWVVVSTVTVSSQTVTLLAATFRIVQAENTAGVPVADTVRISGTTQTARDIGASVLLSSGTGTGQVTLTSGRVNADLTHIATAAVSTSTAQLGVNVVNFGGSAGTFASGRPEVNMTHIAGSAVNTSSAQLGVNVVNAAGTAWGSGAITAASIATDAIGSAEFAQAAADKIWSSATRVLTANTNLNDLSAAGVRAAVGLASANLDTQLGDLPTNAELATALGTADDAVLAAIAALNNLSAADVNAEVDTAIADAALATAANLATVDTVADAIKAKTDSLTFTVAGQVDANIQYVNDVQVNGTGASGDEWGP